jgi:hypothetical protein
MNNFKGWAYDGNLRKYADCIDCVFYDCIDANKGSCCLLDNDEQIKSDGYGCPVELGYFDNAVSASASEEDRHHRGNDKARDRRDDYKMTAHMMGGIYRLELPEDIQTAQAARNYYTENVEQKYDPDLVDYLHLTDFNGYSIQIDNELIAVIKSGSKYSIWIREDVITE